MGGLTKPDKGYLLRLPFQEGAECIANYTLCFANPLFGDLFRFFLCPQLN